MSKKQAKPSDKKQADDKPAKDTPKGLAPISSAETYPLEIFKKLTGQGDWAMRQLRRAGLKVRKVGQRSYVRGSDWHEFLAREEAE